MSEAVKIKVKLLSTETFRPYGQILEHGELIYPETEDGRVVMELLRARRRPQNNHIEQEEGTEARIARRAALRPYVEYVDLKARDNRVLELAL
jgi:hypothetical protein